MMAHDDEILTAYLDGELEPQERREVEARLAAQPELREQLETLRDASKAVRDLPRRKAPASILAAVRSEIARGAEGNGQVIRAGEQFKPAARPSRWRSGLISAAAMLAVGVMIFVAVKPTLLQGPKEMTAETRDGQGSAATEAPKADEKLARNEESKKAGTKADEAEDIESGERLGLLKEKARAPLPAARPVDASLAAEADALQAGNSADAEMKRGRTNESFRAAEGMPQEMAAQDATGTDKLNSQERMSAVPGEAVATGRDGAPGAPGAPGGPGGMSGGSGKRQQSLNEQEKKVAARDTKSAELRKSAPAPAPEVAAASPAVRSPEPKPTAKVAEPVASATPAAPAAPPPAAPQAPGPDQNLAKTATSGTAKAAKAAEYAKASEKETEQAEEVKNLDESKVAAAKAAGEKSKVKPEFKEVAEAKADRPLGNGDAAPANAVPGPAPAVVRLRTGDLKQARAELLALAATQGGKELAQARTSDVPGRTSEAADKKVDDARGAGERLVSEAMKKSEEHLGTSTDKPAAADGKPGEAERLKEPYAGAEANRGNAEPEAAARAERKAPKQEANELKDRTEPDPAGQPQAKVVRVVLQVPASKKAALLAALQQQARRRALASQGDAKGGEQAGGFGGSALRDSDQGSEGGPAPAANKKDPAKSEAGELLRGKDPKAEREEGAQQAAQEPSLTQAPPPAKELMEVIEVLIELVP